MHRWLVLYNPFYLAATLSLLTGVYLINDHFEGGPTDWILANLWVVAILQAYELCLLSIAWWLQQRGLKRPAVLLGLLECLFLVDPTFTFHILAHLEPYDLAVAPLLALAAPVKIFVLLKILDLETNPRLILEGAVPVASICLVPTLLDQGWLSTEVVSYVLVALYGLWILSWMNHPAPKSRLQSRVELSAWGRFTLRRIAHFFHFALPAAFGLHLYSWFQIHGLELEVFHLVVPLLALTWIYHHRDKVWPFFAAIALYFSTFPGDPEPVTFTACALALMLMGTAYVRRRLAPSFGWVLCLYIAAGQWTSSAQGPFLDAIFAVACFILAWRFRDLTPTLPGFLFLYVAWDGLANIYGLRDFDSLTLGIGLAAASFLLLGLGTWAAVRFKDLPTEPTESFSADASTGEATATPSEAAAAETTAAEATTGTMDDPEHATEKLGDENG